MGVWYENFDYDRNPFVIRPDEKTFTGFRDVLKKIAEGIASEEVIIVTGQPGSGKTTLLKFLLSRIRDPLKPIYYNAIEEKFNMEEITGDKKGFLETVFKLQKENQKNIVLLVDEAHHLKEEEIQRIKAGYDSGVFRSLIVSTTKPLDALPPTLVDRASTIISLRPMTPDEAWSMIEKRLNGLPNPFHKDSIKLITEYANGNPRKILKTCEYILKEITANYQDLPTYILPQHVTKVLGIDKIEVVKEKEDSSEKENEETPEEQEERMHFEDVDLGNPLLNSLSPLQKRIILALKDREDASYDELEETIGAKRSTLAKQISRLSMSSDPELLKKKGITRPLVEKIGTNGSTRVKLTEYARSLLEPVNVVEEKNDIPLDLSKITIV